MRLLYFDETEKILSLPQKLLPLGFSKENLLKKQELENAALLVCSNQLGVNHLVMELVDSLLVDLLPKLKQKKWFKFRIKKNVTATIRDLKSFLRNSYRNSNSNQEYMMDMSDELQDDSKFNIFKVKNAIGLELTKQGVKDHELLDDIILIYMLLLWINNNYTNVISHMNNIYNALYDTWFHDAGAYSALASWRIVVSDCMHVFNINKDIDFSKSELINSGCGLIDHQFNNNTIASKITPKVDSKLDSDIEKDLLEAYKLLNIKLD